MLLAKCRAAPFRRSTDISPIVIELTLPYPISANRYWRSRVLPGRQVAVTYASNEAKEYKRLVGKIAQSVGVRPVSGPVEYELDLYPKLPQDFAKRARIDPVWWDMNVQCIDLDNARKVLLDALNGIAWEDDSMVRRDAGQIMMPDGDARVVIRIKSYARAHPQLPLMMPSPEKTHANMPGVPF